MTEQRASVALFGGTFDPVHHGHLRSALEVRDLLAVDEVRMIPAAVPPHREQPAASAEHRLAMLKLAIADETGLVADDRELAREGASYSVDTIESVRAEWGEQCCIALVMGSDAFNGFHSWHRAADILELAHIVVLARPGEKINPLGSMERELRGRRCESASELKQSPAGRILVVELVQLEISASQIRADIQRGGSGRYLLPLSVWSYINEHQLYRG